MAVRRNFVQYSVMAHGINIAALARRTGVPAHTLRKWEERYGVPRPARTEGGQRRYNESDVARVEWLRDRLADGYRIREAAALLGSSDGEAARSPAELRRALRDALRAGDHERLGRLFDQAFAVYELEEALGQVIAPTLARVGEDWEAGRVTAAEEHVFSAGVRARLERLLADARGGPRGTAVLACAPGERHDLGLLMLATLLRADGWDVAYLGADLPLADAVRFAERVGAKVLCLSVGLEERIDELEASGAELKTPGLRIVLGGGAATPALARRLGVRYGKPNLAEVVADLRETR